MSALLETTTLTSPDSFDLAFFDPHFHARRGAVKTVVVREKAKRVCGGVEEPNTNPHLLTYDDVCRSQDEMSKIAPDIDWKSSIYMTLEPNLKDIARLHREERIGHVKSYPPHGSTHTAESVHPSMLLDPNSQPGKLLCWMQEAGLALKRHAEVAHHNGKAVDPYEREALDLREYEPRFMDVYPRLRRILAHLSTIQGIKHMDQFGNPDNYVCELTAHHGYHDRRFVYDGGAIIPDHHCLPVVKDWEHLEAIQNMIRKKPTWLLAASDAAAHLTKNKYRFDAFGGLFTYHCDLELYTQLCVELGVSEYLYAFLYGNAKRFFGSLVPDNPRTVKLVRETWTVDARIEVPEEQDSFTPFGYHPDPTKRFPFMYKLVQ